MKILFFGSTKYNNGPSNVNINILKNLTDEYLTINSNNKLSFLLDCLFKIPKSDIVVISGITIHAIAIIKMAKLLNKKIIYIMHGCVKYETSINNIPNAASHIKQEEYVLSQVDLILAVSKMFMNWCKDYLPEYKDKLGYLFNGIEKIDLEPQVNKNPNKIIAIGGSRQGKNNKQVCQALQSLNNDLFLEVYGYIYDENDVEDNEKVSYKGRVEQDEFFNQLASSQLFVLNSTLDSFSTSVIDALNYGCNVLVSKNAGVIDILSLEENDIIFDNNNIDEIAHKIQYIIENPNCQRIKSSIDYDKYSTKSSVKRLTSICRELL